MPGKESGEAIVTVKVEDVGQEALVGGLSGIVLGIMDAREGRGWGTEGFSPYHWTLEG
jgi:hypothetical protein